MRENLEQLFHGAARHRWMVYAMTVALVVLHLTGTGAQPEIGEVGPELALAMALLVLVSRLHLPKRPETAWSRAQESVGSEAVVADHGFQRTTIR